MNIKLAKDELELLASGRFLPPELLRRLLKSACNGRCLELDLSDDDVLSIDDLCHDELVLSGFDAHYEPTKRGRMLEGLIDKFYAALEADAETETHDC